MNYNSVVGYSHSFFVKVCVIFDLFKGLFLQTRKYELVYKVSYFWHTKSVYLFKGESVQTQSWLLLAKHFRFYFSVCAWLYLMLLYYTIIGDEIDFPRLNTSNMKEFVAG